jgi:octaprenyl-diphosphate synthase
MYNDDMDPQYTRRLEKIEAVLNAGLPENPDQAWLLQTITDPGGQIAPELRKSRTAPGRDLMNRGGKRWRPLLAALVCEGLGGGEAVLPLLPLVEFPHNASLIHDDIEDNSDERRGKPAVHLIYGTDTAINGGSFLYFLPLSCINRWNVSAAWKNRVYAAWGENMGRLHLGQAMDINWHRNVDALPSPEEYTLMCRLKTGALARLAATLGVYAAAAAVEPGADPFRARVESAAEYLGEAVEKLGLGFQILDDVKNLTTGIPGKKRGDDIVEGKKSLPVLLYLRQGESHRETLGRCFAAARTGGTGAAEVEELIRAMDRAGAIREAEDQGRTLIREARDLFARGTFPSFPRRDEAWELLAGLADLIS